jgi:hypothetical protein
MTSKAGISLTLIVGVLLIAAIACGDTSSDPTPIPQQESTEPTPQPTATAEDSDAVPQPTAEPTETTQPTPQPDEDEGEPVVFQVGPCEMTAALPLPIEFEYQGSVPTGFDGFNRAGCNFSKPVQTVTVVLTGCCQSAKVGRIGTRENYCYGEPALNSLTVLL